MKNKEEQLEQELKELPKYKLSEKARGEMLSLIKSKSARLEQRKRVLKRIVNSSAVSAAILFLAFLFFSSTGSEWRTLLMENLFMSSEYSLEDSAAERGEADFDAPVAEEAYPTENDASEAAPPPAPERAQDDMREDGNIITESERGRDRVLAWNRHSASFEAGLLQLAKEIMGAIKERDMTTLAQAAHPTQGILFSPYAFIDGSEVNQFTVSQLYNLLTDQTIYMWGYQHGSGEPLELTPAAYWEQYVYDQDFVQEAEISYNERAAGDGGMLNNIEEVYPEAVFVEFHYTGSEEWSYLDWSSLRLVFEEYDGLTYLVALVHDQWTP